MPIPAAPIAATVLRYGAVALAGYALAHAIPQGRRDQRIEDVMDDLGEGIQIRRDEGQTNLAGRFIRTIGFGVAGPTYRLDIAFLGRFRINRKA